MYSTPPGAAPSEPAVPAFWTPPGGAAAPWHPRRPTAAAPIPVSPEPVARRPASRAAAAGTNDDDRLAASARSSATIAVATRRDHQRAAPASSSSEARRNARSLSPMVRRKDYAIPKNSTARKPLSDGIHPEKYLMKKDRKLHSVAGGATGAFVGGLLTGPAFPVGVVIGAAAGGYASNKMHKMQERRRQRRHEQRNFQKAAKQTAVARSDSVVYV